MGITEDIEFPSDAELTVQEINLSGPALKAGAFHLGKACENENNEFMLCRHEITDPRQCLNEGKAVTQCALNFFRAVKKTCYEEFEQYMHCLDQSSMNQAYPVCRNTQGVFDKCMKDNLNLERPYYGYFTEAKVHKAIRPRPPKEGPAVYPDATPGLPEGVKHPPAKHGTRYMF